MTRAHLQPDVRLGVSLGRLVLWRVGLPSVRHALATSEGVALLFLSSTGDPAVAAHAAARALGCGPDVARRLVDGVLDRFAPFLGAKPAPPSSLSHRVLGDLGIWTRAAAAVPRRSPAPRSVTWLVTLSCTRRCAYCYFQHGMGRRWGNLSRARALRLVADMGRLGSADLYLTGGEPLLRRDLPSIIAAASDAAVRTHVTTKYAIDAPLARALARSRLTSLEFSLDDARPAVAAQLSGSAGFHAEAMRAIRSAVDAGLRVSVAAVVLRENAAHLGALAALAARLGAHALTLNELRPRGGAQSEAAAPDAVPIVRQLRRAFSGVLTVNAGPTASRRSVQGRHVCDAGWRTLDLLPDGTATRCRYRPDDARLHVGSVATEDLLAVWRGRRLRAMVVPRRAAFAGTRCTACKDWRLCSARGWCVASVATAPGRLGPDAFCTRAG